MHTRIPRVLAAALILCLLGAAVAGQEDWHGSLDEGMKAARQSGKPLLVITTWKDGL